MKYQPILYTLFIFLAAGSLFAETAYQRELQQLKEQRDKAVATAVEPINRRYKDSLELLLKRSTQGNDLDTALKVKEAMQHLSEGGGKGSAGGDIYSRKETTKAWTGTQWRWDGGSGIQIRAGGEAYVGGERCTWSPEQDGAIKIVNSKQKKATVRLTGETTFEGTGFDGAAVTGTLTKRD